MAKGIFNLFALALFANLALVSAQGAQFITGPCTSDADCASGCCGFNSGNCAGPIVALERDGGCGFGDPEPNDNAAVALLGGQQQQPPANNANNNAAVVTAPGTQFITGACTSDADCASGCCGFNSGKCAGPVVALERDGGCGFGDLESNDNAAVALQGGQQQQQQQQQEVPANNANNNAAVVAAPGTQFITGICTSDTDCASGCCGFLSGKCAGPVVAQERDGGCGFGDAQPNDNAAKALRRMLIRGMSSYRA
ncbi:hypothetical protein AJ80_02178 [Polytolypa hystricis UAMH7299]|uniref:Biotrophy-associated secreted protein 2 n=1 Tax=Polytolypa hystricis (strain UAMH7299) TaxID=1447883 RepID=A0A2B7YS83_POLH7|nr:hypothetical protein AJ80_02178 [Polytolypa hystricis UAMH7299]